MLNRRSLSSESRPVVLTDALTVTHTDKDENVHEEMAFFSDQQVQKFTLEMGPRPEQAGCVLILNTKHSH